MGEQVLINSTLEWAPVRLTSREREFIEKYVLGPHFPWFWQDQQTFKDDENIPQEIKEYIKCYNGPFLSHTLLHRLEDENVKHTERPAKDISTHFEFFLEIFHRFMFENNLKYSKIFRANLNLTWSCGNLHSAPHLDHTWPHKNFIMYLTTCDKGHTIIWPDDFSTSYMIPCEKYTAVTFSQLWHAQRYPMLGSKRIVLVITYI
jgi:hypothetical protein